MARVSDGLQTTSTKNPREKKVSSEQQLLEGCGDFEVTPKIERSGTAKLLASTHFDPASPRVEKYYLELDNKEALLGDSRRETVFL